MTQAQKDCCALLELIDFCNRSPRRGWQINKNLTVGAGHPVYVVTIGDVEDRVAVDRVLARAILTAIGEVKNSMETPQV